MEPKKLSLKKLVNDEQYAKRNALALSNEDYQKTLSLSAVEIKQAILKNIDRVCIQLAMHGSHTIILTEGKVRGLDPRDIYFDPEGGTSREANQAKQGGDHAQSPLS
jgi:Skp family chaperone for outer membrane proteins